MAEGGFMIISEIVGFDNPSKYDDEKKLFNQGGRVPKYIGPEFNLAEVQERLSLSEEEINRPYEVVRMYKKSNAIDISSSLARFHGLVDGLMCTTETYYGGFRSIPVPLDDRKTLVDFLTRE